MFREIQLETDRLLIRDHRMEDLESHHQIFTNNESMYYHPDLKTDSFEKSKENLVNTINEISNPNRTQYFLRIENKYNHEHIGEIGYTVTAITPLGKLVHLGYFIYKNYWNMGFVSEALNELMRFAFEENDVFRIATSCLKENIGSERVMQKCGLIKEAELKQAEWHDGKMKDRVTYRILREEWAAMVK